MMSGQKLNMKARSNYFITMEENNYSNKSKSYLGKISADFKGVQYILYDSGLSPTETTVKSLLRKQYGAVFLKKNF